MSQLDAHVAPDVPGDADAWLAELGQRVAVVRIAGEPHVVSPSDLGLLRDALGVPIPAGHAAPDDAGGRDPLTQLIARYARTHAPFTLQQVADAFGLGTGTVALVVEREAAARRLTAGRFTPGVAEQEYVDPEVLRRLRSRSLAVARAQLQPISQSAYARFLAAAHQVDDRPSSSPDELLIALQRLAGATLPASSWETHVLPSRLKGYSPAHLDTLLAEGEVVIRARGSAGPNDPLIALLPVDDLDLLPPSPEPPSAESAAIAVALAEGDGTITSSAEVDALWRAVEEGAVAPVSMAPVRARVGGSSRGAHRAQRAAPRRRARLPRPARPLIGSGASLTSAVAAGRWYRVRDPELPAPDRALALASSWLERFGIVTRGGVTADGVPGGFGAAYRLMTQLESAGKLLRGYIVDGLGGAQFSTHEVIEQARRFNDSPDATQWPSGVNSPAPIVLTALDPANPYGSVLPWPAHPTAHPSRAAGALVVIADGVCIAHLTRGGRTLTLFADDATRADRAALTTRALIDAVSEGRMSRLKIEEIDGERVGSSGLERVLRAEGGKLSPNGIVLEARRA